MCDILELYVRHPKFFALIDIWRSLHAVEHGRQHLRRFFPVFLVIPPAGDDPGQIVIVHEQAVPAFSVQLLLPFCHTLLQLHERKGCKIPFFLSRLLIQHHMFKLEYHGELASVRIAVQFCIFRVGAPCLPNSDQIPLLEGLSAHLLQKLMEPRTVIGDLSVRLFRDLVDHIQAEPSHAFVHPPEDHIVDLPAHLRILPV